MPTSAQLDWAIRFARRLLELGTRSDPDLLTEMGEELFRGLLVFSAISDGTQS